MRHHEGTNWKFVSHALLLATLVSSGASGCSDDSGGGGGQRDPCVGVTCSGHGTCVDEGGSPSCQCDTGYVPVGLDCVETQCGDGLVQGQEACDDGNTTDGDGCNASCTVENGWTCDASSPSSCSPICGDGLVVGNEQCDDGNTSDGDGCSASCTVEDGWTCDASSPSSCSPICGDALVVGDEQCDDGNTTDGDGCSASCSKENGWTCDTSSSPTTCSPICGDALVVGDEQCDDGNTADGDGCSASCAIENGWTCDTSSSPTTCSPICGDNHALGDEVCDGTDLKGKTCKDFGRPYGQLSCSTTCDGFDTSQCAMIASVSAGAFTTCAVDSDGRTWCWGEGDMGQIGDGQRYYNSPQPVPTLVNAPQGGFVAVSVGSGHVCAIHGDTTVWCWGTNASGALGNPTAPDPSPNPVRVLVDTTNGVNQISVGQWAEASCGVFGSHILCWGDNTDGRLGVGDTVDPTTPMPVPDQPYTFYGGVSTNGLFTCATGVSSDKVWCWGQNPYGLGDVEGTTSSTKPIQVMLPDNTTYFNITVGRDHACVLEGVNQQYTAYCWGSNASGQLGLPTQDASSTIPVQVRSPDGLALHPLDISAGSGFTCAVDFQGQVWCWGRNDAGELGTGQRTDDPHPDLVQVQIPEDVSSVSCGINHACAVTTNGQVWCWGNNMFGQLGNGTTSPDATTPTAPGLVQFPDISP